MSLNLTGPWQSWSENLLHSFQKKLSEKTNLALHRPGQTFPLGAAEAVRVRKALIEEEAKELLEALDGDDPAHVLKEICDLVYVTVGTAVVFGLPYGPAFERVHYNNMDKIKNGTVREDGKLVKPADHPKVDFTDLLNARRTTD